MVSKISNFIFACIILLIVRDSATESLLPKCDYGCQAQDLDTGGDYFASGSAISSQFLMPDGSVLTNSKETSISSDGIKQTFHELKKEADRFVQIGQGGSTIHSRLPSFGNIPSIGVPSLPQISVPVSYYTSGHESYPQSCKDQQFGNKIICSLSPSSSSQYGQAQTVQSEHVHSNSNIPCEICAVNAGKANSENTASYHAIVGNVAPVSGVHSRQQKYESSSAQKNSTYQIQPIAPLFSDSVKPNTFTTNFIDLNNAHVRHLDDGAGSESRINYQEQGSSHIKSEERVISQPAYGGGPVAYPSRVVVSVNGPSAVNSHVYEKQQSSSHVQTAENPAVFSAASLAQQAEAELSKQQQSNVFRSPVLLGGVPQPVPIEQHGDSYQSSHSSYFSSSSGSSSSSSGGSKSVGSNDESNPVVAHQIPQKLSASNGYSSSHSSSSGSSGSFSQSAPEVYYNGNKIHGASSSIYDQLRGDQVRVNANAETLCNPCTYVAAGTPVKNTYGVATSFSSQSSTINGKTTENREAAVTVNDNGKVDRYHVKT